MAVTSPASPATEAARALRPSGWLRAALLAAIPACAAAVVVQVAVGDRVLDRAVALEERAAPVLNAPFTRAEQQAGLFLGDLVLAVGIAAVLAGLLVLAAASGRAAHERWLDATFIGAWAVVVVPAVAYPPLPPGVDAGLDITARQWLFAACVALGAAGAAQAVRVARDARRRRRLASSAAVRIAPVVVAAHVLPAPRVGPDTPDLLLEFRLVSLASQLAFWVVLALAGAVLLRRPARVRNA